jgi:hypothetical protein
MPMLKATTGIVIQKPHLRRRHKSRSSAAPPSPQHSGVLLAAGIFSSRAKLGFGTVFSALSNFGEAQQQAALDAWVGMAWSLLNLAMLQRLETVSSIVTQLLRFCAAVPFWKSI